MSKYSMADYWNIDEKNQKGYFITTWAKILVEIDFKKKVLKYIGNIPDSAESMHLYVECFKYDEMIFCFPDIGNRFWRFDCARKKWNSMYAGYFDGVRAGISIIEAVGNYIYLLSKGLKAILCMDLSDGKIISRWDMGIDSNIGQFSLYEGKIYIVDIDFPRVYEVDYINNAMRVINLNDSKNGFHTLSITKERAWFTGKEKKVFEWNFTNEKGVWHCLPEEVGVYEWDSKRKNLIISKRSRYESQIFLKSVIVGNFVFFIPFRTDKIVYYNMETEKYMTMNMVNENEDESSFNRDCDNKFTELAAIVNGKLYLCSYKNSDYAYIDTHINEYCLDKFKLDDIYLKNIYELGYVVPEEHGMDIKTLLDYMVRLKNVK